MKKLLLLFFAFISMASKADVFVDGIYYYVSNGEATVTTKVYDNYNTGATYYEYRGSIIIPETIEYEGQTIPVTGIDYGAFRNCTELTAIKLPQNLKTIRAWVFAGCTNIEEIEIPANVNTIDPNAFSGCERLSKIVVNSGNTKYDSRDHCNAIVDKKTSELICGCKNTKIPNGVKSIGRNAFINCIGLVSIEIPASVVTICEYAFSGCTNLTEVKLNEGLENIYFSAFANCSSLKAIVIPASVHTIQKFTTGGNTSVPRFTIGESVFGGCTSLESIKVSSGNTVYDSRNVCNAIIETETNTLLVGCKNTVIPEDITDLYVGAFQYCSTLESLRIPSSIRNLDDNAYFLGCTGIKSITVDSDNPFYDSRNDCNAIIDKATNTLIFGCINTIIPNSVEKIGTYAFFHYDKWLPLTSIVIPSNVTSINTGAFYSCKIENVIAKNSKTLMGGGSFSSRTYQHAMVYIPQGTWSEAVFDGGWYMFNNIREITTEKNNISQSRAYMLMNTENYGYAVFDEADDEVKMVKAFYSMDEHVLNNNWQVRTQGSNSYLYNLGAKKFASISANGRLILTNDATPLTLSEGENGIIIDADGDHEWAFVKNNSINEVTAIEIPEITSSQMPDGYYSLDGQHLTKPQKGVNIIRMNDGTTKKIIKN